MKILLAAVNAKYIHSCLAVYSLKAAAGVYGEHIAIGEYTINQQTDEILRDLYKKQPRVVAFSCYIWNWRVIRELVRELPKVLPGVRLWVGGPEVSYNAREVLVEYPELTGVLREEGEGTFLELAAYYIEGKGSLSLIRGLTFREQEGEIRENTAAEPADMNRLPFVYEDMELFRNRILYYESSRGCPFRCSYCLSSIEKTVRCRSLALVKKDLGVFLEAKVPQVKFVDRTFNADSRRAAELWKWILDNDNGVTNFHFEIGADQITEEQLAILSQMRPGLVQLEIGVQSTNPETIRAVSRRMDLEELKETVERIRGFRNIHQHLDLIAGLPGEDLESFRHSFDEVFALRPHNLQLGFLKVLKGSPMQQKAAEYGLVFHEQPPYEVLRTNWLAYGDILLLKGVEEMVEVYFNSRQFEKTLERLLCRYKSPFDFFHELAVYYESRGYDKIHHSRIARYEILREFLNRKNMLDPVYDQCMVYDLYAREKLKSRPPFAADRKPFRQKLREYERDYGKEVHVEVFLCEGEPQYVLFDYQRRDPLTREAHVELLR